MNFALFILLRNIATNSHLSTMVRMCRKEEMHTLDSTVSAFYHQNFISVYSVHLFISQL